MKKIFYFIASAIVALGAVACQNDIEEGIDAGQQTEGFSIKVTIDDQTRVDLGDFEEGKGRKLTFTEGDVLVVRSGWNEGTNYLFEYTQGEGDLYTFTCTAEGVSDLVGTNPSVFYLGGLHEKADELTDKGLICNTAAESIEGIGMYANNTMQTSTFGAEDYVINMVAMPLLKFTANEPVTFRSDSDIFFVDNNWAREYTTNNTGEIYLPIITSSGNNCTVTVTTDSGFEKSFTKILEGNTIYNLGTIEAPAAPAEKVYLVLNNEWKGDNAWFAAYFWNATTSANKSITMTDAGADGIYECEVPADMDKVIFCRMNPQYTEFSWDVNEGEGENFKVLEDHVWNQTADLEIGVAPDNYYYIIGWESGLWGDENTDPTVSVAGQTSEWALVGAFNGWKDNNFITTATAGVVVLENVTMKAAEGFLVRKPSTDWADKYGASSINYLKANHFITTSKDGVDMCLEADGTYDIYFDANTKNIYIMTAGTDYTTATKQTANGQEPENEEVEVTENVLYLKPNSNWKVDNARFAAYFFKGSTTTWVSMTDSDSDGIYEVNIPTGYNTGNNVIFCRMNPSTTANNWNNKWNQTADLVIPTDGKNLYTVKDGTWDKGGGTWSTK